jgi:hypothetical protein
VAEKPVKTPDKFLIEPGKPLGYVFAKRARDDRSFGNWRESIRPMSNPRFLDALELATLAFRRWRDADSKGRVANYAQEIQEFKQDNPYAEVSVLVLVRALWMKRKPTVGLCYFRRTWCNNIFIEILTRHPAFVNRGTKEGAIRGVGTALLYFVTSVALALDANVIWGEATQNSAKFYQDVFKKSEMTDLIFLTKEEYTEFVERVSLELRERTK